MVCVVNANEPADDSRRKIPLFLCSTVNGEMNLFLREEFANAKLSKVGLPLPTLSTAKVQ